MQLQTNPEFAAEQLAAVRDRRLPIVPDSNGQEAQPSGPGVPQRIYPYHPWDLRLYHAVAAFLVPRPRGKTWFPRTQQVRNALLMVYPRFRQFLTAILSRRLCGKEYADRMEICKACDRLAIYLPKHKGGVEKWYCRSCRCPKWFAAELKYKNRLSKHYCPERKHPGPHPLEWAEARSAEDRKFMAESMGIKWEVTDNGSR